jgi:hypothetical protein
MSEQPSSNLVARLRACTIAVPKPGSEPFVPAQPFWVTMTTGPHAAGEDAGLQYLPSLMEKPLRVQQHVYVVEPLHAEAADEIERYSAEYTQLNAMYYQQKAEIERLRAALEKYGDHTRDCALRLSHYKGPVRACDCGWYERNAVEPSIDDAQRREDLKARGCNCGASMHYKAGAGHFQSCPLYADAPPHPTWRAAQPDEPLTSELLDVHAICDQRDKLRDRCQRAEELIRDAPIHHFGKDYERWIARREAFFNCPHPAEWQTQGKCGLCLESVIPDETKAGRCPHCDDQCSF